MTRVALSLAVAGAFALAAIVATPARAAALDQLHAFLAGTKSGSATFTQRTSGRSRLAAQPSSGTFAFVRPGKFRWTYEKPFEQVIVGDGRKVWVYDRDLNQVVVRNLDAALGGSPAALLSGDNALEKNFTLVDSGSAEGLEWVEATPKGGESSFAKIRIGFRDGLPRAMELNDTLGATTRLDFGSFERNPALDPKRFVFIAPQGADIVGDAS